MGNPVVHFEIQAADAARQQSFYEALFAWKIGAPQGPIDYQMVEAGQGISGGLTPTPTGRPDLTFYIQVDDLDATLGRAASLGTATVIPPTALPRGGRFAVIRDPEGNALGLMGA